MTDAFSSNSEAVLQRTVNVPTVSTSSHAGNLMQLYQITETCHFVTSNQFKKARQHRLEIICHVYHLSNWSIKGISLSFFITGSLAVSRWTPSWCRPGLYRNREWNQSKDIHFRWYILWQVRTLKAYVIPWCKCHKKFQVSYHSDEVKNCKNKTLVQNIF